MALTVPPERWSSLCDLVTDLSQWVSDMSAPNTAKAGGKTPIMAELERIRKQGELVGERLQKVEMRIEHLAAASPPGNEPLELRRTRSSLPDSPTTPGTAKEGGKLAAGAKDKPPGAARPGLWGGSALGAPPPALSSTRIESRTNLMARPMKVQAAAAGERAAEDEDVPQRAVSVEGVKPPGKEGAQDESNVSGIPQLQVGALVSREPSRDYKPGNCEEIEEDDEGDDQLDGDTAEAHEEEKVEERTGLILPDHVAVTSFEVFYVLCACADACVVTAAAGTALWDDRPQIWKVALHAFSTFVYVIHILMQFRVAVLQGWQLVDEDQTAVRNIYLRGWFPFDLTITFPYDLIVLPFSVYAFRILQLVRALRVARLYTLFNTSNPLSRQRFRAPMGLVTVLLVHHGIACVHTAARHNMRRSPDGAFTEYTESLYWAIQTTTSVGYGDIDERGVGMRWLALTVMLFGSGLYGWFLGQISAYVMSQDHVQRAQEENRNMLMSLMDRYDVPLAIQKEAFCIYPLIFATSSSRSIQDALDLLPPFMQEKINDHMSVKLLRQVPMFAKAERSILSELAARLTRHVVEPDCELITVGEIGKEMYFLMAGAVEVLVPLGPEQVLRRMVILRDGSWFGEIAILKETRRTAAIRTITACDLFMLTKEDFWELLMKHPKSRFEKQIFEEVERRMQASGVQAKPTDVGDKSKEKADRMATAVTDATVDLDAVSEDAVSHVSGLSPRTHPDDPGEDVSVRTATTAAVDPPQPAARGGAAAFRRALQTSRKKQQQLHTPDLRMSTEILTNPETGGTTSPAVQSAVNPAQVMSPSLSKVLSGGGGFANRRRAPAMSMRQRLRAEATVRRSSIGEDAHLIGERQHSLSYEEQQQAILQAAYAAAGIASPTSSMSRVSTSGQPGGWYGRVSAQMRASPMMGMLGLSAGVQSPDTFGGTDQSAAAESAFLRMPNASNSLHPGSDDNLPNRVPQQA
eukprot:TRINITY_DN51078_c0_g1_i1.p1 TRINITY_DN51078_c0_g1~~TRINITY_DN51078_c0_g1_i1.p1  ORF type:complete len:1013 (+),score=301.85 TRINITY_DN51078_c0_g1_i1:114-3041(+)